MNTTDAEEQLEEAQKVLLDYMLPPYRDWRSGCSAVPQCTPVGCWGYYPLQQQLGARVILMTMPPVLAQISPWSSARSPPASLGAPACRPAVLLPARSGPPPCSPPLRLMLLALLCFSSSNDSLFLIDVIIQ